MCCRQSGTNMTVNPFYESNPILMTSLGACSKALMAKANPNDSLKFGFMAGTNNQTSVKVFDKIFEN